MATADRLVARAADGITSLPGIGPAVATAFDRLGLQTLQDLWFHLPLRYEDRTQITAINFVGNSAYSGRRLSDVINTKRSSWLSFVLRDDVYDEDKLRADQELLRRFYYNHGYADFQVVSAVGELDNATNKYTVTITVQEGDRYTFGDVSVESTIPEVDSKSL